MTISLSAVQLAFGDVVALEIESLVIDAGASTVLVGPNGAGKSTLLMIVAGLLRPGAGDVMVDEFEPGSVPARATTSFAPDQPALFDDLTIADQVAYIARLHKVELADTRCRRLIESLNAEELLAKFPRSMSKGQRQKASLIVATARPFDVLLLDEPTTALDAASRHALVSVIGDFAAEGVTVVSSTHDRELIDSADAQVTLIKGRLAPTTGAATKIETDPALEEE